MVLKNVIVLTTVLMMASCGSAEVVPPLADETFYNSLAELTAAQSEVSEGRESSTGKVPDNSLTALRELARFKQVEYWASIDDSMVCLAARIPHDPNMPAQDRKPSLESYTVSASNCTSLENFVVDGLAVEGASSEQSVTARLIPDGRTDLAPTGWTQVTQNLFVAPK